MIGGGNHLWDIRTAELPLFIRVSIQVCLTNKMLTHSTVAQPHHSYPYGTEHLLRQAFAPAATLSSLLAKTVHQDQYSPRHHFLFYILLFDNGAFLFPSEAQILHHDKLHSRCQKCGQ